MQERNLLTAFSSNALVTFGGSSIEICVSLLKSAKNTVFLASKSAIRRSVMNPVDVKPVEVKPPSLRILQVSAARLRLDQIFYSG